MKLTIKEDIEITYFGGKRNKLLIRKGKCVMKYTLLSISFC